MCRIDQWLKSSYSKVLYSNFFFFIAEFLSSLGIVLSDFIIYTLVECIIVSCIFQRKKQVNRTELLSFFFLVKLCKSQLICTKSNCTCVTNKSFLPKALTIQWNYIVDNQPNMSKPIDPASWAKLLLPYLHY